MVLYVKVIVQIKSTSKDVTGTNRDALNIVSVEVRVVLKTDVDF